MSYSLNYSKEEFLEDCIGEYRRVYYGATGSLDYGPT